MFKIWRRLQVILIVATALTACAGGDSQPFNSDAYNVSSDKHLYVASGACYGGGVTVSTGPANTVARFNLATGLLEDVVIDYNALAPGDSPVSIADYDATHFLVLVENASGRRLDLVHKKTGAVSTYIVNSTALSGVMRAFAVQSDYSVLVSKSTAIEKFNSAKVRVLSGAAAYINAPAAPCATSTTLISSIAVHSSGKIVYTHAAVTPNNRIGVIKPTGYSVAADCVSGTAGPATTALPTRAIFHSSGKLLVAYGSLTAASNAVYAYDFDGSSGAVSNPTQAYGDTGTLLNGPSSMVEDPQTGDVFVANVTSTFNTIERFHVDPAGVMTRATSQPFVPTSVFTRCVSDMKVMN